MHIQDKIGRDLAGEMEFFFPELSDMVGELSLHRFFLNKPKEYYNNDKYTPRRNKRDWKSGKIILPFELTKCLLLEIIDQEQFDTINRMIKSEEDYMLAEDMIEQLRLKRMKKYPKRIFHPQSLKL